MTQEREGRVPLSKILRNGAIKVIAALSKVEPIGLPPVELLRGVFTFDKKANKQGKPK